MKFCPNCGYKFSDEKEKFCRDCGFDRFNLNDKTVGRDEQLKEPTTADKFKAYLNNTINDNSPVNGFHGMMSMMGMMGAGGSGRSFSYSSSGMSMNSGCDYNVKEVDGKLIASVRMPNLFATTPKEFNIEDEVFNKITSIIDKYDGDKWDGFNKHATDVMDGTSYSFSYCDGKDRKIHATGYMCSPDGFGSAMREIFDVIDEIYYINFPDYYKIMEKYIVGDVIKKYGETNRSVSYGNIMGTSKYLCFNPDRFVVGENSLPPGFLTYRLFGDYCREENDDPKIKVRAITVMIEKVKAEDSDYHGTGLKLMYWGFNENAEIELLDEYLLNGDFVRGQEGSFYIFTYNSAFGPVIGYFLAADYKYGDLKQKFHFYMYKLAKDKLEIIDEDFEDVSVEQGILSDEQIEKLAAVADKACMDYLANYIRTCESRKYLNIYPSTHTTNSVIALQWKSFICDDFVEATKVTKPGEQIKDCRIEVYKMG